MRRVFSFVLSIVLLISFIPYDAEANSFVKDIDVLFSGFQLKVGNKRVPNHKEPFLYDGEFFVSLSDLAKGLDMNISISGNTVHLNSKGKLNFDANSSNKSLAFQRGYEIMAKDRIAELLQDEIDFLEGKVSKSRRHDFNGDIKNIRVGFGGISVNLDGKKINLDTPPLKYRDDVFVSIDTIAPYLYITPSLSTDRTSININANDILVKSSIFSTIDALLASRENRNYLLDIQRAELEKRKYILKDLKLPYKKISSIKSLENYLNDNFNTIGELKVELSVVKQSNWINLDIKFSSSGYYLWNRLKRSDVEQWVWNIYTAVLNLYDENALISGVIRNPYYSSSSNSNLNNYVTFYTKDNDLYFDFSKSRLDIDNKVNPHYIVEHLKSKLPKYYNRDFSYEATMSGDNLVLKIYSSSKDFNSSSIYTKMGYLKSINQNIRSLYPDLAIEGEIIYPDSKISPLDFYISENRIRSLSLLEETNKYINASMNAFAHNYSIYRLDYSLGEKDLRNFNLYIIGDFSTNDYTWIGNEEILKDKLNENVNRVLTYIASLWDANIVAEVVDKNGVFIEEYSVFQENVSVIYASQPAGQVPEGTMIYLYTTTTDAKIYYTIDGSTPTTSSYLYTGNGIMITRDMTINAIGYRDGFGAGEVSSFSYTTTKNDDLSNGLTGLNINGGSLGLTPGFSRDILNYTVSVSKDINSITLTPYATAGVIKIGNEEITSGQAKTIALVDGANTVSISVKEDNKKEKVYTIIITKETGEVPSFNIDNLRFSTLFDMLVFNGRLRSNGISDFSPYSIRLVTKTGKVIEEVKPAINGDFNFPNDIVLDWFDKLVGFKYEIYHGTDKVSEGDLN